MNKSIIFYTDNKIADPIKSVVRGLILGAGLSIVTSSLKPVGFGFNIILQEERGYVTMIKQILIALERSTHKYVFFCEHDVLYPKSHFDFTPPRDDIFYYNENVYRWLYGSDKAIRYNRMISLSGLCCNRELALGYFKLKMERIEKASKKELEGNDPILGRKLGHEPGTKKIKRGGLTDQDFETWKSEKPLIDIRHDKTFSPPKVALKDFTHKPTGWEEIPITNIPGWEFDL